MRKYITLITCTLLFMLTLSGCSSEAANATDSESQAKTEEVEIEEPVEVKEEEPTIDDIPTPEPEIELEENEYLGVGDGGIGGETTVKVTIDDGKINKIDLIEHHETVGIGTNAINELSSIIITENSTEVDSISGATMSSTALKAAVNDAISKSNN